jgi:formylglycine-generating enzyme required for sulfatase activity
MKECQTCLRCFPDDLTLCPNDGVVLKHSIHAETVLEGRYQLEKRIGQGGMGIVYKGRHVYLKTMHAIKVILPDLVGNDPSLATRFRQEAMAAAAIRHLNVVSVTDFGMEQGVLPFLVMEFVKGRSLHEVLVEERKLSLERAVEIVSAVGAGVHAAHTMGIVHRDLKPLNIMLQEGLDISESVRVLDFGLAKIKSSEWLGSFVQAETTGLLGSPFYMAPELWSEEEEPDPHADIYSLGIILYQMLAGDVPFKGPSAATVMRKHLMSEPPAFASLGARVPKQIEAVVNHALQKNPAARPQTMQDFINELREAMDQAKASPEYEQLHKVDLQADTIQMSEDTFGQLQGPPTNSGLSEETIIAQKSSETSRTDVPVTVEHKGTFPRSLRWLAAVILPLILVAMGYGVYKWRQTRGSVEHTVPQMPTAPIKAEMVAIPGGTFMMGRDDVSLESTPFDLNQWPANPVKVGDFYMDRTEVTNTEYAEFVRDTKYQPPGGWKGDNPPPGQEMWPVRDVSSADAQAFAEWRSKRDNVTYRLPTEEEWEYAARNGDQATLYPWGKEWSDEKANVGTESIKPVGSYPQGASRWGLLDLIGNVWEWTSSKPSNYPGNNILKIAPTERDWLIVRGGSFVDIGRGELAITATRRRWIPATTRNPRIGFRLVREGQKEPAQVKSE